MKRQLTLILLLLSGDAANAASRFWVGGTGTWDNVSTTHWSVGTGGANGASAPGPADTANFDGASGGGTVTVNAPINVQAISGGNFTGSLDFSVNNNDVIVGTFSFSGVAARTLRLGNGTWTITALGAGTNWSMGTISGLTFSANSSTLVFPGGSNANRIFAGGGLTYNNVTFQANASGGQYAITGANTFNVFTVAGQNAIVLPASTITRATTLAITGSSGNSIGLLSSTVGTQATVTVTAGTQAITWAALRDIVFNGGATFTCASCMDLGDNSGITITAPASGGGSVQSIGDHGIGN